METQANKDEGDDYDRKRAEDRRKEHCNLFDILRQHRIPLNAIEEKEFGNKKDHAIVTKTW
tara:strand:- start:3172 stop:3354 length:183 start_codon:yes stop_codon:yes gene_type:complete